MQIHLEPGISEQQKINIYLKMKQEREEEIERVHQNPLWPEIKGFAQTLRPVILRQMRREIVGQKKNKSRKRDD